MLKPINNKITLQKTQLKSVVKKDKTNSDIVSFGCNPKFIISTTNPENAKKLMIVSINNLSHKTNNVIKKFFNKIYIGLMNIATPAGILTDKNTVTFLNIKENIIKGGIIAQKNPQNKTLTCFTLVQDEVKQSKKERLQATFDLAKYICKKCDEDGLTSIVFYSNKNNKKANNLFKKFAFWKNKNTDNRMKYEAYVDRLKEFLEETKLRHKKIIK